MLSERGSCDFESSLVSSPFTSPLFSKNVPNSVKSRGGKEINGWPLSKRLKIVGKVFGQATERKGFIEKLNQKHI